jgi:hypothetical protein
VLTEIATSTPPTPQPTDFKFQFSSEAAAHNSATLASNEYDLDKAFLAQGPFTPLSMGSELRPIHQLDKLFSRHPSYKLFRWCSIHGINYLIQHLSETQRRIDLEEQLQKGNHKLASVPSE